MQNRESEKLLEVIRRALSPLAEVQAALLFGSRGSGRARVDSDIDVAVLLDDTAAGTSGTARVRRLIEALTAELAADRLDLVILNDAPPALVFQVLKHGKVAFERDPIPLHRLRVRTYSRHADFAHTERFFRDVVRRRALSEVQGG